MNKAYPFSFYFLYYAAMAAMLPFLVLFYQQLGFTGTQIGILTGISPLIIVIGGPFWTGVADATRRHRVVMSLGIGMAVLASLSFLNLRSFWAVAAAIGLFNFFLAPVIALADGATVASLGAEREKYGRVRLGGTLGWAVSAFVAGLLIERFGLDMSFWSYAVLMFLALLVGQDEHDEAAPFAFQKLEGAVDLAVDRHIEWQCERAHLCSERQHTLLQLVVGVRDGELCALTVHRLRDAPGDGPVVGNAHDEAALAGHDRAGLCKVEFRHFVPRVATKSASVDIEPAGSALVNSHDWYRPRPSTQQPSSRREGGQRLTIVAA